MAETAIRHDWTRTEVAALFALPFNELLHRAHTVHKEVVANGVGARHNREGNVLNHLR